MKKTTHMFLPRLAGTWLTFTVLASCGGDQGRSSDADREFASLLPADTVAVVRIEALDSFATNAREVVGAVGEDPSSVDIDQMLRRLGPMAGDIKLIDRKRPMAIALSLVKGTPPAPIFLVPATDPAAYSASLGQAGLTPVVAGGYVVIKLEGKYEKPNTPSTMADNLPAGIMSSRADVEKLVAAFGPMIGVSLSAFEKQMASGMGRADTGFDGEAMAAIYVGLARSLLASARSIDLAIDYRDGKLAARASLMAQAGSDLDGWSSPPLELKGLEQRMSGKGSFEMIMMADWAKMWPRLEGPMAVLMDMYPPAMRDPLNSMMAGYRELYLNMGPIIGAEGDIGDEGIDVRMHIGPGATNEFRSTIEGLFARPELAQVGFTVVGPTTSEAGGTSIVDYELGIDTEKLTSVMNVPANSAAQMNDMLAGLFGKTGRLPLRLAIDGDRVAMSMGKKSRDGTAKSLDSTSGTFAPATKAALKFIADCNPLFVERLEMAGMMRGVAKFMRAADRSAPVPNLPTDANAEVVFFGGVRGSEWRAGFSVDVVGFAKMVKAPMPR